MNTLNTQKGFVVPLVIAIIVVLVGGGLYVSMQKGAPATERDQSVSATAPTTASIKIFSPNGGETYKAGSTVKIVWTASVPENASIALSIIDGKGVMPRDGFISVLVPNTGSYEWKVPVSLTAGDYKLAAFINSEKGSELASTTSARVFRVTAENLSPSITVVFPNGSEKWTKNQSQKILWNSEGLTTEDTVRIGFRTSDESVCWYVSASPINAMYGSLDVVPSAVRCEGETLGLKVGGTYKVQVVASKYDSGKGVADTSDSYFTITN